MRAPSWKPPQVEYLPRDPKRKAGIALVGCGGISRHHLQAYVKAGYRVLWLCDVDPARATGRRDQFFPSARATADLADVLADPEVVVCDITTHPAERVPLIEAALKAGKHVLSQKPFVLDLDVGKKLIALAAKRGVLLAVNQNARWAPHFSYLRGAVEPGLLGRLHSMHFAVHWDHSWTVGTPFEKIRHLILYDYAVHWFDMLSCVMPTPPRRVFASFTRSSTQTTGAALLAQVLVEYEGAQATLVFDGHSPAGEYASYVAVGSSGLLRSEGRGDNEHQVVLVTPGGQWRPQLTGQWFDQGFHGTMGELLCSIEQGRTPSHAAATTLPALELCFAAIQSAETGQPVVPGTVRKLPDLG